MRLWTFHFDNHFFLRYIKEVHLQRNLPDQQQEWLLSHLAYQGTVWEPNCYKWLFR